jgi:hypothetical protein
MDLGSEKGGYILSADIAPHFFIGGERLPIAFSFTPRYKVRIFRNNDKFGDSSLPVRTPSYMPGGTLYVPIHLGAPNVYKNIRYISLSFFHHSNGQDHPTFSSPGVFNLYNGNFSTNIIEAAYCWNKRFRFSGPDSFKCESPSCCPNDFDRGYFDWIYRIGLEQHEGTAFEQRGTYSRTRLNFKGTFIDVRNMRWLVRNTINKNEEYQLGQCYLRESYRVNLNVSLNIDQLDDPFNDLERRINAEIGVFKRIAAANTAIFAMVGYYGNDPYNIYYSKNYAFIRAGLALGFFVHTNKL